MSFTAKAAKKIAKIAGIAIIAKKFYSRFRQPSHGFQFWQLPDYGNFGNRIASFAVKNKK